MKKHFIGFLLVVMAGITPATAQENKDDFDSFRKGIKDGFNTFRKKVLNDYDKYLDGVWHEYNAFRGEERSDTPKPRKAPVAQTKPEPPVAQSPILPECPVETSPANRPEITVPALQSMPPNTNWAYFNFYGIIVRVPTIDVQGTTASSFPKDFAILWKQFSNSHIEKKVLPYFEEIIVEHGFNDWFTFELIRAYVDSAFGTATSGLRIVLTHYLLVHLGYDVRIGLKNDRQPMLLVAFKQMVYARSYTILSGQRYYSFYDNQEDTNITEGFSFCTYDIPNDMDAGSAMDLLIRQDIEMPYSPHRYYFQHGNVKIEGEVNANVIQMLYRYPQMPVGCYAKSVVNKNIHEKVAEQLRQQLTGIPRAEAVDTLLHFVQSAFQYATDEEQHGFEKPYFFEETLFYPQCDCEDRSIFYSYLLWQVLEVENHLISYPGHECVAVHLDSTIHGCCYRYNDKEFYISDPTYIGSVTGMCMPAFLNERPEIELSR